MKRKRNKYLSGAKALCALLCCLHAACTQGEMPGETIDAAEGVPLQIGASMLQGDDNTDASTDAGTTRADAATRAANILTLHAGDIGVFRRAATGYEDGPMNNINYYYDPTGGWKPRDAAKTIRLLAPEAEVCAYFPYSDADYYNDPTALPLYSFPYIGTPYYDDYYLVEDVSGHAPNDLRYATVRTVSGEHSYTDFRFVHAMAMLKINLRAYDIASECKAYKITLSNPALANQANIDITDGSITPTKQGIEIPCIQPPININTGVDGTDVNVLLVPCDALDAPGIRFTFTIEGQTETIPFTLPTDKLPRLEAGKVYNLKMVLRQSGLTLEKINVYDWVDAPASSGTYTREDCVSITGKDGTVMKWARRNLLYTADYQYSFATGAEAGSLFAGNTLRPEDEEVSPFVAWDPNLDPCGRMEPLGTWVTPTQAQWENLPKSTTSADNINYYTTNSDEDFILPDTYYMTSSRWSTGNAPICMCVITGSMWGDNPPKSLGNKAYVRCIKK